MKKNLKINCGFSALEMRRGLSPSPRGGGINGSHLVQRYLNQEGALKEGLLRRRAFTPSAVNSRLMKSFNTNMIKNSGVFKTQMLGSENKEWLNSPSSKFSTNKIHSTRMKNQKNFKSCLTNNQHKSNVFMDHQMRAQMKYMKKNKVCKKLLSVLKKLHKTKHDLKTDKFKEIFPVKEFQILKSKKFLEFVKKNDVKSSRQLLKENPYLVYQIDRVG